MLAFLWVLSLGVVTAQYYDTFTGQPTSQARVNQLRASNLIPQCAVEVKPCNPHEPRRLDYTCNNLKYPARGSAYTPYHRMLPAQHSANGGLKVAKSGNPLPNARRLRVGLVTDARKQNKKHTHLITNIALVMTGDITSIHDTVNYIVMTTDCCTPEGAQKPECIPIPVDEDDLYLRQTGVRCLNLTRAITYQRLGCVPKSVTPERVNSVAPMLELSLIYGHSAEQAMPFREMSGGRLKGQMERGMEWPPEYNYQPTLCLLNRLPNETKCQDTATSSSNSLVGATLGYMLFYRLHNQLARSLEALNPCWDDEQIFYTAREITIGIYANIVYYEWAPEVLGFDYLVKNKVIFPGALHVDDYDPQIEPRVAIEYVTTTRWFHVIQEGRGNLYTPKGKLFGSQPLVDLTLRSGALPINNTMEGLMQGSFRQGCGFGERTVDPDIGERALSSLQRVTDLVAADIMKGRDQGLPSYNDYRKLCKLPVAKSFSDLYKWFDRETAETMETQYEHIDDVELMAGILSEKPMNDAMVGPVLGCIMADQLLRWRRADRFWYQGITHPYAHTEEQLREIQRTSMAKVLCLTGDSVTSVQPNPFRLPTEGNEIIDCKYYGQIDVTPWKDQKCHAKNDIQKQYGDLNSYYDVGYY